MSYLSLIPLGLTTLHSLSLTVCGKDKVVVTSYVGTPVCSSVSHGSSELVVDGDVGIWFLNLLSGA